MANCIIAQSGGPTAVINSSVVGLVEANNTLGVFDKVYAGLNGIEGILNGNIIELSSFSQDDINRFRYTPSSGLGSCRYKMKKLEESTEEYDRLLEILKANDIKAFFYVGGNDSMDTTAKLSAYAKKTGIDIKFIGIPKTIDNDLMYTDHTPGFGSAAKFIATSVLFIHKLGLDLEKASVEEIMNATKALADKYDYSRLDIESLPLDTLELLKRAYKEDPKIKLGIKKNKNHLLIEASNNEFDKYSYILNGDMSIVDVILRFIKEDLSSHEGADKITKDDIINYLKEEE